MKLLSKHRLLIVTAMYYTLMWFWLLQTDSFELSGTKTQGFLLAILTALINVLISVFIAKKSFSFAQKYTKKYTNYIQIVMLLAIFALNDFLISWLVSLFWIGPEGRIDSLMPMTSPALILINSPFVYASRLIGFFGLSAFCWTICYLLLVKRSLKLAAISATGLVLISAFGFILYKTPSGPNAKATIISESLDRQAGRFDPKGSDLVIFPEYGLNNVTNRNLSQRIKPAEPGEKKAYFVGSEQVFNGEESGHINRLLSGNNKDGITNSQYKYRLIPGGEDSPYLGIVLLKILRQQDVLDYFNAARKVKPGNTPLESVIFGQSLKIGSAICSSIFAPQDYRHLTKQNSNVLVNPASLKPFNGSRIFAWQLQSMGRFMAVANSRYFLQSANSGTAVAIDNNGKINAKVIGNNYATVDIKLNNHKTIYTQVGEWMPALGAILSFGLIIYQRSRLIFKISSRSR